MSEEPAETSTSKGLTRREFLKMLFPAAAGAYAAVKAPDLLPYLSEPEIGEDKNWNAGELDIQAYPAEGKVKFYARPYGYPRFEVALTHVGSPVLSEAAPHKTLFTGSAPLSEVASGESYTSGSTGYGNRVIGSMYPVEAGAKYASIKQNQRESEGVTHDNKASCVVDAENLAFRWEIEGGYEGDGYFRPFRNDDRISFVSGADFPQENVVGMKPSEWLKEYTGAKTVIVLGGERFGGVSLEHTTPAAWVVEGPDQVFAMAASYANHATLSYARKEMSDRRLSPAEDNYLNTPTPFVVGSNIPTDNEAEFIASLPEKTFNAWKEKYPQKPFHQGQTFIYNKEKRTFRVVERPDRLNAIKSLTEKEVWLTPGEVMRLDGENHFSTETRYKNSFDMTLNGFIAVPDEFGEYHPVYAVSTDQRRRFSLSHTEQIANGLREQLDLPKEAILINWDKHGAGGIFVGKKSGT